MTVKVQSSHGKKINNRSEAAIGYVRVSTDEQASSGLGLESQRRVIEGEASAHGWHLADLIADEGLSAKSSAAVQDCLGALQCSKPEMHQS